jgi:ribosomal protein L28
MDRVNQVVSFTLLIFFLAVNALAQQPSPTPTPERTGRSYTVANLPKNPPPPGPQARSPLTFTDVTAQIGINFRHAASKTSRKFRVQLVSRMFIELAQRIGKLSHVAQTMRISSVPLWSLLRRTNHTGIEGKEVAQRNPITLNQY